MDFMQQLERQSRVWETTIKCPCSFPWRKKNTIKQQLYFILMMIQLNSLSQVKHVKMVMEVRISQYFFSHFWFNKTSMSLYSLYSNLMTHVLICQCSKVVCKGSGNQVIVDESPRLSDFFGCQITLRKPLIYVSFHCRVTHTYKYVDQKIWEIPMQNVCCVS